MLEDTLTERFDTIDVIGAAPPLGVLPLVLFVAIYEEIVFRGILLSRLSVVLRSRMLAVPVGAVLFAVLHYPQGTLAVLQIFGLGVVLGTIAVKRRNIWPCIVAHALWNGGVFFVVYLLRTAFPDGPPPLV